MMNTNIIPDTVSFNMETGIEYDDDLLNKIELLNMIELCEAEIAGEYRR